MLLNNNSQVFKSRLILILTGFIGLWLLLFMRAAYLQIWPDQRLLSLKKKQYETIVTLKSRRGDVLDRKNNELAVSVTSYSLFADPHIIEDPHRTARILAKELHMDYRVLLTKLKQKKKRFVWLQRFLDRAPYEKIQDYKVRGLGFIEEAKRIYPNDQLLSHVLGFVGSDGEGLEGLESRYNEALSGKNLQMSFKKDARGRPLIVNGQVFSEAPDGADIILTIDRDLQYVLEQELRGAVLENEAEAAMGVILNPQTSEILAMANWPTFNPNAPADYKPEARRNRSIVDAFEPGSTMKTFVMAAGLNHGIIEPNSKFFCENGSMKIGNRTIREADSEHKFGWLTTTEILAHSSNIGTTKVAMQLKAPILSQALSLFGFGEKLSVDLPAEANGTLLPLPWREHLLSNISFGHGISTTPLQIANAYAAIANGGWLKRPYLVKSIRDHETGQVMNVPPKTLKRAMLPEAAAKLRLMLMSATAEGSTGEAARIVGFPVAGKTGTAQKVRPGGRGYLPASYISSFAGFLPANDPRFVIYIAVDNPKKNYYGSAVAAPVFARVARYAIRQAGLAPVLISKENLVPQGKDEPIADELEKSADARLILEQALNKLRTTNSTSPTVDASFVVPELSGLSLREVLHRLDGVPVTLKIKGQGMVSKSIPAAGTRVDANKHLTVILK